MKLFLSILFLLINNYAFSMEPSADEVKAIAHEEVMQVIPGGPVILSSQGSEALEVVAMDMRKFKFTLFYDPSNTTLGDLKRQISSHIELNLTGQILRYKGKKLDDAQDHQLLKSIGIEPNTAIYVSAPAGSGPNGGVALFAHGGISAVPKPDFAHECDGINSTFVRWEVLHCPQPWPHQKPIAILINPKALSRGCNGHYAQDYLNNGSIQVIDTTTKEIVIEAPCKEGLEFFSIPHAQPWKRGTKYLVKIQNQQGRGVGFTFVTD